MSDVALSRCNRMVPQKFVNDLLTATYTEEYMACHSLGGKSSKESSKAALPPADVQQIIGKCCLMLILLRSVIQQRVCALSVLVGFPSTC